MSTPYTNFPQITYIHFVEYSFNLSCTLITLISMGSLLYNVHFNKAKLCVKEMSASMQFYLSVHICCSVLSLPFLFYKVFWWRPPQLRPEPVEPLYSAYPFFYMARCMRSTMQLQASWFSSFVWTVKFCESQSCQQIRLKSYPVLATKTCVGIANVICCAFFLRLLAKVDGGVANNLDNRIIKITVIIEIFLNVIPGDTYIIYKAITGVPLSSYTGELSYVFMALDGAICGCFYWRKFRANPRDQVTTMAVTSILFTHARMQN